MERIVGKVRVYEIARAVGMSNDDVVDKLRARGEPITSASSTVHAAIADAFIAKVKADRRPASAAPVMVRRKPIVVTEPVAAVEPAEPDTEPPAELFDVRTRYERELAAARARTNRQPA